LGRRWKSSLAITIAEETVGHPHKFRANHGEARASELEFIVNSRLPGLVETSAIKDKVSPRNLRPCAL
jgi:hypothetical protein